MPVVGAAAVGVVARGTVVEVVLVRVVPAVPPAGLLPSVPLRGPVLLLAKAAPVGRRPVGCTASGAALRAVGLVGVLVAGVCLGGRPVAHVGILDIRHWNRRPSGYRATHKR